MHHFFRKSLAPVVLTTLIIFSSSFKIGPPIYERLRSGNISNCAFYSPDSFSLLKFKDGYLTYTRWNSAPGAAGRFKVEEFGVSYTFNGRGMCGTINGIPFMVLNKELRPNSPTYYLKYNGLSYFLSELYSE